MDLMGTGALERIQAGRETGGWMCLRRVLIPCSGGVWSDWMEPAGAALLSFRLEREGRGSPLKRAFCNSRYLRNSTEVQQRRRS